MNSNIEDIIVLNDDDDGDNNNNLKPYRIKNVTSTFLTNQNTSLIDSYQIANDKILKLETKLRELTSEFELVSQDRDYLAKKNELNEQEITKLRKFVEDNKKYNADYLNKWKKECQEEVTQLREKLLKYEKNLNTNLKRASIKTEIKEEDQKQSTNNKELELRLENVQNENNNLQSEIQSLKSNLKEFEDKNKLLEDKYKNTYNALSWTQVELKRYQTESKELKQKADKVQQQLDFELCRFEANKTNNEGRIRNLLKTVTKLQEENYNLKGGNSFSIAPKPPTVQARASLPIFVQSLNIPNQNSKRPNEPITNSGNKHFKSN